MPITQEFDIQYSDPQFFEAMENPSGFLPFLQDSMNEVMTEFVRLAEIPANESEANRPGRTDKDGHPIGYYERGRGWWYPILIKGHIAKGSPLLGKKRKAPHTMGAMELRARKSLGVAGYKLIPNSEQMEENWIATVNVSGDNEVTGELMNIASYSSYVQGQDQIQLHKLRGWQTVEETWNSEEMQSFVSDSVSRAVGKFYNLKYATGD